MFGYVTVDEGELKVKDFKKYKAYYCGLCSALRDRHGVTGQLTLTYDMAFVVVLLTSLYECRTDFSEHRCKVHPFKKQRMLTNEMTVYAADMNIILSYYHMKDDWADEKKPGALLGLSILKKRAGEISERYPRQCRVIKEELLALSALEKEDSSDIDSTAGCFGRLMAELLAYKEDIWAERLRGVGFYLGKFIYIMDAYEDMDRDIEKGCFNPLKGYRGREDYEERCRDMMCMMIGEACSRFESLPCVLDIDILRNILYGGVWNRYRALREKRTEARRAKENDEKSI